MGGLRTVHTWEEHGELRVVLHLGTLARVGDEIGVIDGVSGILLHEMCGAPTIIEVAHSAAILLHLVGGRVYRFTILALAGVGRSPELTDEQRTITVLFAVQVAQKVEDVLRVVLVDRWVGRAPDDDHGIGTVTHQDDGDTEQDRVPKGLFMALGPTDPPNDEADEQRCINQVAAVER